MNMNASGSMGAVADKKSGFKARARAYMDRVPVMAWLIGALIAVALEQAIGYEFSDVLGLPKIPVLFGFNIMLKKPQLIPGAMGYVFCIYLIPVFLVNKLGRGLANNIAGALRQQGRSDRCLGSSWSPRAPSRRKPPRALRPARVGDDQ